MNKIITISREFGSGGKEIGKRLAEQLKFAYYDSEIITLISKETGMSEEYINNISEKGIYPYAFQFAKSFAMYPGIQSIQTDVLIAQQKVIKEIAEKGDCVIVGRCADTILEKYKPMNIFVYADINSKIARCLEKSNDGESISEKELIKKIRDIDVNREKLHNMISDKKWGDKDNYHLCINTTGVEIKNIIPALKKYVEQW